MKQTRRAALKAGGLVATAFIMPITSADSREKNPQPDLQLRLRGSRDSPLDPLEVQKQKKKMISRASHLKEATEGLVGNVPLEIHPSKRLIAYNLDIIGGKIVQWKGTIDKTQEISSSHSDARMQDPETDVLERAEKQANAAAAIKSGQESLGSLSTTELELYQKLNEDVIPEWGVDLHDQDFHETNAGNKAERDFYWAINPSDDGEHAVNTEVWVRPNRSPNLRKWNHTKSVAEIQWKSWYHHDDHGPGNTIGSNADYVELSTGTQEFINVAIGSNITSSNLDIDDKSDPDEEYAKHKFDIGGDLQENYVELNLASTASGAGKYVATSDFTINFQRAYSSQNDKIEFGKGVAKEDGPTPPEPPI